MHKIILLVTLAVSLAGCASPQELASKECASLGLRPGSPAFANCYEQSLQRRQSVINAAIISQ